jgi:hypothetical protein
LYACEGGVAKADYYALANIDNNVWYRATFSRCTDTMYISLDGVPLNVTTVTAFATIKNMSGVPYIGVRKYTGVADRYMYGWVDELKLSSGEISDVVISAEYDWTSYGNLIKIVFDHGLNNEDDVDILSTLTVTDENLTDFPCLATYAGETKELMISVTDFNESVGDLTINFGDNPGTLLGEDGQDVGAFNISFSPTDLIEYQLVPDAPIWEEQWNG